MWAHYFSIVFLHFQFSYTGNRSKVLKLFILVSFSQRCVDIIYTEYIVKSNKSSRTKTDLLRSDAADDALLHPVDHVLLLHSVVEVLQSDLVVQAPLHLTGHHV